MAMMTLWTRDYDKMFANTESAIESLNNNQYYDLKTVCFISNDNDYYNLTTYMKMTVIEGVYEFVATTTIDSNDEEMQSSSYSSCYKDGTFYRNADDTKFKSVKSIDSAIGSFNDSGMNLLIPESASLLTSEDMLYASTNFKFSLSPFYIGQTIRYRDVEQLDPADNIQLVFDISAFGNLQYFGYEANVEAEGGTIRYVLGTYYLSHNSFTLQFPTDLDTYTLDI